MRNPQQRSLCCNTDMYDAASIPVVVEVLPVMFSDPLMFPRNTEQLAPPASNRLAFAIALGQEISAATFLRIYDSISHIKYSETTA